MPVNRRDGAAIKRERIERIRSFLSREEMLPTSLSRFIAWCEVHIGLSPETIRRYLNPLEVLGEIEIDEARDMILKGKGPKPSN